MPVLPRLEPTAREDAPLLTRSLALLVRRLHIPLGHGVALGQTPPNEQTLQQTREQSLPCNNNNNSHERSDCGVATSISRKGVQVDASSPPGATRTVQVPQNPCRYDSPELSSTTRNSRYGTGPSMAWSPRNNRLATLLALLALLLRTLLPALHDHHEQIRAASPPDVPVAACSCGTAHPTPTTERGEGERTTAAEAKWLNHHCFACQFEARAPSTCAADLAVALVTPVRKRQRQLLATQPRPPRVTGLPAARAPPDGDGQS